MVSILSFNKKKEKKKKEKKKKKINWLDFVLNENSVVLAKSIALGVYAISYFCSCYCAHSGLIPGE